MTCALRHMIKILQIVSIYRDKAIFKILKKKLFVQFLTFFLTRHIYGYISIFIRISIFSILKYIREIKNPITKKKKKIEWDKSTCNTTI